MGGKGSGRKRTSRREHGTSNCYAGGCRCGVCRKGWREYIAQRRALRRPRRYYGDRRDGDATVVVRLSPLSAAILTAAEARTSKTRDDVVEQLLRMHGGAVRFEDDAA